MKPLTLALDWTPNVNHIGLFVAKERGFYRDLGLEVAFLTPQADNYALTPAKKLELDLADFAIAPFESVISLNNKAQKVNAVAIYAILQEDLSSIVTLQSAAIRSPRALDGKIYASYKARYEDQIVKQMIVNSGGNGDLQIIYPDKLGIWNTLLEGRADATWIFDNWEGVEAEGKQVALTRFRMRDFEIPYGYSPVVMTKAENISSYQTEYSRFVEATREGFLFTQGNLEAAAAILKNYVTDYDRKNIDLYKAVAMSSSYFGDVHTCGVMQAGRVRDFLDWLVRTKLEDSVILDQVLFSNTLLPQC